MDARPASALWKRCLRLLQAVEFESTVNAECELRIPNEMVAGLPRSQKVRAILLFPIFGNADNEWSRLTATQFLDGYAPSDSIYDQD